MSYILEAIQKSSKTDWQGKTLIKPALNSSAAEKGRVESNSKTREKSRQNTGKSNNSSVREQIFHPVDRLF